MFDPLQAYYASKPIPAQEYLDEEQFAQRYGHVVVDGTPIWNRIWLRVGELLIRTGEKLTAANTPVKWHKETV
jgi:hypothetical protein